MNTYQILDKLEKDLGLIREDLREWNLRYFYNAKNRYLHDLEIVKKYCKNGKILEIGSAPYHFTYCLKNNNYDIIGIDLDPERGTIFIEKHGLNIIKCDIERETLPFENNQFDLVVFNEVFEHLRIDPIFALKEINRVMKFNGILILTTPNLYSLEKIVSFNLGRGFNNPYKHFSFLHSLGHAGHIRIYSSREIKEFLKNTGFYTITVKYMVYEKIKLRLNLKNYIKKFFYFFFPKMRPHQIVISKK